MGEIIVPTFEKDGETYPPAYAECATCFYSDAKVIGFDFIGEVVIRYCDFVADFVDDDFYCVNQILDRSKLTDEQEEEYDRIEESGEIYEDEAALIWKKTVEDFKAL